MVLERQITWTNNGIGIIAAEKRQGTAPAFLAEEVVEKIAAFHSSVPGYAVTPLAELPARAKELGLENLFVKDESHRFGLMLSKDWAAFMPFPKSFAKNWGWIWKKQIFPRFALKKIRKKSKIWCLLLLPMATTEKA